MARFCRSMRGEKCDESKDSMLDCLIALLDDTNGFSWQSAKASHAILLCQMEQGEISSWSETDKMPRDIPIVTNLLVHIKRKKFQGQNQAKLTKSMPCVYYNNGSCSYHETKGVYYKHIWRGHGGRVVTDLPPTSEAGPGMASSGKAGSCLSLVGSLWYKMNWMYWFPLPSQLPVVI